MKSFYKRNVLEQNSFFFFLLVSAEGVFAGQKISVSWEGLLLCQ